MEEATYGQRAVGTNFNPSGHVDVNKVKNKFADLINTLDELRASAGSGEQARMLSIAITGAQTACMRAVKAITRNV